MPRNIIYFLKSLSCPLTSIPVKVIFCFCLLSFFPVKSLFAESTEIKKSSSTPISWLFAKATSKKKLKTSATSKKKRQLANTPAYSCSETFKDKYSTGYIQVGYNCDTTEDFCIAFFHIERNRCKGDDLIRYYCDPEKESLFSSKSIPCSKGCEFIGLSGTCKK